jgi:hypothetical protein
MSIAADIIAAGLDMAGNTSILQATALGWLNNFLQSEYQRKYRWQRKTIAIPVVGGVIAYPAVWDATFLGLYQQRDQSVGRFTLGGTIAKLYPLDYRDYIVRADRLSATGPPRGITADDVGAQWFIYPVPDGPYGVTVDIYYLPPLLALGDTPLWSAWAPEEILVKVVEMYGLEWQDDSRAQNIKVEIYGDQKQGIPGMLATYRRRLLAQEGQNAPTSLDQTRFLPMGPNDAVAETGTLSP